VRAEEVLSQAEVVVVEIMVYHQESAIMLTVSKNSKGSNQPCRSKIKLKI
jgi:hypothetical protein